MNIQIIGDNFNVSQSTKDLVEEKVGKRLDKLLTKFAPEMKIVLMHIEKDKFDNLHINLDMNLPGKEHIFANTSHKILESGLIHLAEETEKQIKKYKDKLANYSLG
ncbi:HPF/RaiA family ribosome-associated protein [Candidatus Shapirobacteria bacterium]|nr:HPF/RaiA family ribosome-associated protein [Candidatus Shapirobacteria bacterium]